MLDVRPPANPAIPASIAGLNLRGENGTTLFLPAGHAFSVQACLALSPWMRVLTVVRHEQGNQILRDPALEGRLGRAKWIGHWLIRLDALRAHVGWTSALILDGQAPPGLAAQVERLERQGAVVHPWPHLAHRTQIGDR